MPTVGLVTDPEHAVHRQAGHTEGPERLDAILQHLDQAGLRQRLVELAPRLATDKELLAVHDQRVLDTVHDHAEAGGGWIDMDTYVQPGSPEISRRAAGAAIVAVQAVLDGAANGGVDRAFVAVRPPGHHATRLQSMGFCLFNHIAIAAAHALRSGVQRLAIVDWDVHHGNGTQDIFNEEPRLLYVSTHASPYYPGTGDVDEVGFGAAKGTKVNIPLPHYTGDAGFRAAYERVVIPALDRFQPELILVSCGFDAHERDPLGTLAVSTAGYTHAARLVRDAADRHAGGRMVVVLEGGYDLHALGWCAGALCELLLGDRPTPDPSPGGRPETKHDLGALLDSVRDAVGLE